MLKDVDYDVVVGPESRGFIFGVPVAYAEHKSFVPIRKKGKLPRETIQQNMIWNMAQLRLKSTKMPSNRDRRLLW